MEPIHLTTGAKNLEPFSLSTAVPLSSGPLPNASNSANNLPRNGRCPGDLTKRTASGKTFFSKVTDSFADTAKAIGDGFKTMSRGKKDGEVDDLACKRFTKVCPNAQNEILYGDYQCNILCKNGEASGHVQVTDKNLLFIAADKDLLTVPLTDIISILRIQIALNRIIPETGSTTNGVEVFFSSKQYVIFHEFSDNEAVLDCFTVLDNLWRKLNLVPNTELMFVQSTAFSQPVLEERLGWFGAELKEEGACECGCSQGCKCGCVEGSCKCGNQQCSCRSDGPPARLPPRIDAPRAALDSQLDYSSHKAELVDRAQKTEQAEKVQRQQSNRQLAEIAQPNEPFAEQRNADRTRDVPTAKAGTAPAIMEGVDITPPPTVPAPRTFVDTRSAL